VLTLIAIGLLSGIVTGLSPCVLPVLPVVLTTSAAGPVIDPNAPVDDRQSRMRPFYVIGGLVTSFAVFTLLGSALLAALGLPQDFLRNLGIVAMVVVGIGFLIPAVSHWLERPFARIPQTDPRRQSSAFLFGATFGLVFVPCAGPVLATITVVAASKAIGWQLVLLTVSFAVGVAIPLLVIALAGQRMTSRVAAFRKRMPLIRKVTGVVLIATALAVAFNVTDVLQRSVPGYVSALQSKLEGSKSAKQALDGVRGAPTTTSGLGSAQGFDSCAEDPAHLHNCGAAPVLTGISAWLNTPSDKPLALSSLRGRVVLVDFWTYSCINCQRTLPYLEAWDKTYRKMGLTIIGVHTPEFAFEHVVSNINSNAESLGVRYPIAVDNDYKTWNAYKQQYWPAHYLIDAQGVVRQVHFGEGQYRETESLIRELLKSRHTSGLLPATTAVRAQPITSGTTPETYLGSERGSSYVNTGLQAGKSVDYRMPVGVVSDSVGLGGGWSIEPQFITAGPGAKLRLHYFAGHVYLVLGGRGTLTVQDGGAAPTLIAVNGAPRLYELRRGTPHDSTLTLSFTSGLQAYSFTFG
jgi:cytochrome c biogenesis protein CcdA/thiol-disulfide isomerase/thioredoxin